MTDPQPININLDHIVETLRKGVRRADIFMGIGLNASTNAPPISHVLATEGFHHINLVKDNLTQGEQEHVALEFGKWVRASGIRELIETFSVFCDQLYRALFVMQRLKGDREMKLMTPAQFEQKGVGDKMEALSTLIEVSEADRRVLRSLNQARNCYAHRQGRIGERDVSADTKSMVLIWNAFQVEAQEPNGNIVVEQDLIGYLFEEGGMMQLRVIERIREFALGAELVLDKRDLKEICFSTLNIGQRLLHQTVELAKNLGILKQPVDETIGQPQAV